MKVSEYMTIVLRLFEIVLLISWFLQKITTPWYEKINSLKTKLRLLYLKTQFVQRCKHFSSQLQKPISLRWKVKKSLFVLW
jgi:hypothetical protein